MVNQGEIQSLLIPVCSVKAQHVVVNELDAKLSVLGQFRQTITDSLKQSEALRQSILKKTFNGQLVPQDPADEPVSALLARIRAARERQVAKPWGRASKAEV